MGSDAAMANASIPAISKDFGKKKRANRSAKLKQCKLDARREQWLSQVKNKDCKVTSGHSSFSPPLSPPIPLPRTGKKDCALANDLHRRSRGEEKGGSVAFHSRDLESPIISPISTVFANNSLRKGRTTNSICSGAGSSSSSSSGSYSRSVSDADEEEGEGEGEEEGSLDDWEAVADALNTNNEQHLWPKCHHDTKNVEPTAVPEIRDEDCGTGILKKPELTMEIPRAWRPDDQFRPQSLPNLSKQHSFPVNLERHRENGTIGWAHHGLASKPSSCPICYEDLDLTDSSFLPCSCGFHLCLFCHKRILEVDGRCPGCRKQYSSVLDGEMDANGMGLPLLPIRLSRSCSMSS